MTHSMNRFAFGSMSAAAVSASTVRLNARMPPNAESGSPSQARLNASASLRRVAAPHGLLCLTTTHAGSANSRARFSAESRSRMLL